MNGRISSRYPLLLPLLTYVAGVLTDTWLKPEMPISLTGMLILILLIISNYQRAGPGLAYSHRYWFGVCICLLFVFIGITRHQFFRRAHIQPARTSAHKLIRLNSYPEKREKSFKVQGLYLDHETAQSRGEVVLYLENEERAGSLSPGGLDYNQKEIFTRETIRKPRESSTTIPTWRQRE